MATPSSIPIWRGRGGQRGPAERAVHGEEEVKKLAQFNKAFLREEISSKRINFK